MAITEHTGDIFTTNQPAIAHGCNIRGKMGAGIAKIIRGNFPEIFPEYADACERGVFLPGDCLPTMTRDDKWIMNLATQDNPGRNARLDWVGTALQNMFEFMELEGVDGVAIPRIGAGIGGLEWDDVKELIFHTAARYDGISVELWSLPDA